MRYRVTVDGVELEVRLTPGGLELEGGEVVPAELAALPGTRLRHLRLGHRGLALCARRISGGWEIEIGGRLHRVRLEDERTRAIREVAGGRAATPTGSLRAPMPGLIVRVEVEAGQRVEEGTPLVVMEAMKMENELRAATPGTVTAVEVRAGQTVNRDDLLVSLEP